MLCAVTGLFREHPMHELHVRMERTIGELRLPAITPTVLRAADHVIVIGIVPHDATVTDLTDHLEEGEDFHPPGFAILAAKEDVTADVVVRAAIGELFVLPGRRGPADVDPIFDH
jgi:hypothetical protein